MYIDERIVVKRPFNAKHGRGTGMAWRRAVLRAIWEVRTRHIIADGVDIFNVLTSGDDREITIRGEFDVTEVPAAERNRIARQNRVIREALG